jgi:hypothetical protein
LNDTQKEAKQYTSLTPSGIEVLYQSQPKRLYKVRGHGCPRDHIAR